MDDGSLRLEFPCNGDVLNRHDGVEGAEGLRVEVRGWAWPGAMITCQGADATAGEDGGFAVPATVTRPEETLKVVASSAARSEEAVARVKWDAGSRPRYRFSVDDNIEFLADLGREPDAYPSLFDHWYMAFWREMRREYGAKIHLNIYLSDGRGFALDQLSDRWRGEWEANSDWLRLTFHARQDKPDRIYKDASYEEIARDAAAVREQILRVAGPALLSQWTTLHWGECTRDGARALRDDGYRGLIGWFWEPAETCTTRYYLTAEQCSRLAGRDAWKDFDLDLLFINCDVCVNIDRLDEIEPHLEAQRANPHTGELIEFVVHEQYYRRELHYFLPDIMDRTRVALRWVTERGYEPVFWAQEFLD
jgi:hypothetical protein